MVCSLWGNSNVDWEFLPAVDSVGGVLLLWDKRVLEKLDSIVNQFSVSCLWKGVFDGMEWVGTGIYCPTNDLLRRNLWEELSSVHQTWSFPWCVFRDFNVVCFPSERLGCNRLTSHMTDFSDFIEASNLVTFLWEGVLTLGVVVQPIRRCLKLIGFLFLLIGRITTLMLLRTCCSILYPITSFFC